MLYNDLILYYIAGSCPGIVYLVILVMAMTLTYIGTHIGKASTGLAVGLAKGVSVSDFLNIFL